ncbi:MAG: glycosyl-4,4'-diaponeurosporenoate acyltransferase [Oscillospiraceae bacterium]|nr:glycosyl-4,4'-diaponeurosporenoate acyltransferase [Oscillospiraceae bacterium]
MKLLQCAIYVAALGLISNPVGNLLPRRWFRAERFPYRPFSWEREGKIYEKLHIRVWKDRVPDMSRLLRSMVPKAVTARPTAESLDRLVRETCVAEAVHWALAVLSLGVLKIWKGLGGWICYGLCLLGNLPFIIIQRYNRPRLLRTLNRLRARTE